MNDDAFLVEMSLAIADVFQERSDAMWGFLLGIPLVDR